MAYCSKCGKLMEDKKLKKVVIALITVLLVCTMAACGTANEKEPDQSITFVDGKLVNMNDTEYVGVFFDYTNNSGETALPCESFDVKAFQNGKELTITVFTGQKTEDAIQCDTAVQTGTTANVVWIYEKEDDSPVSVECSDGQKFEFELK